MIRIGFGSSVYYHYNKDPPPPKIGVQRGGLPAQGGPTIAMFTSSADRFWCGCCGTGCEETQ